MTTETKNSAWYKIRSDVYIRDKGICWICNEFVDLKDYDLGHLIDRCMNGEDSYDNVAVMHMKCNMAKPLHATLEEALKWKLTNTIITRNNVISSAVNYKRNSGFNWQQTTKILEINEVKPLTITWIQGKARWLIPPREDGTYHKKDKYACGRFTKVKGCKKTASINGSSPHSTIEIIGDTNNQFTKATIDFGFIIAHIENDGELKIKFSTIKEKTNYIGVNRYSKPLFE